MRILRRAVTKFFLAKNPLNLRKQVEEAMVNVIRDPIRRKKYGSNSDSSIMEKGFNHLLFDTGQMWKAIKAKVRTVAKKNNHV